MKDSTPKPEATESNETKLRMDGMMRSPSQEKMLHVYLNREPTDAEFLTLHNAIWKFING